MVPDYLTLSRFSSIAALLTLNPIILLIYNFICPELEVSRNFRHTTGRLDNHYIKTQSLSKQKLGIGNIHANVSVCRTLR